MIVDDPSARDEAVAWAIRAHDESFDDWNALADWLAADPYHAELYDRVTIAAEEGVLLADQPQSEPAEILPISPAPRRAINWLPLALAAGIVAAVGGAWILHDLSGPDLYEIATRAGETREVHIGDSVRIALDGGTRLTLDRHNERFAQLDDGEALFTVTHDPRRPFQLQLNGATVTDVGTIFDVERAGRSTVVSVAEGGVRIAAAGSSADASAGQMVTIDGTAGTLQRRDKDAALIGGWRQGRVDFDDIPLAMLAARLERATGITMIVAPGLRDRHASGSIAVDGNRVVILQRLAGLLGVSIEQQGDHWIWSGRASAGAS